MKLLPGGKIKCDKLPESLVGKYGPVPNEPGVFQLIYPLCIYRDIAIRIVPNCNRRVSTDHCSLKNVFVSPKICQQCEVRCESKHSEQVSETG